MSAGACSDDDDDHGLGAAGEAGGPRGGAPDSDAAGAGTIDASGNGGMAQAGGAGAASGGLGGAAGGDTGTPGGAGADSAGAGGAGAVDDGTDRDAFRPIELPFSQAAFEALNLPAGFSINVYRTGLGHARMLATHGPHVYLTRPMSGDVVRLVDADENGVAEDVVSVASGLPMVHGIAFHGDEVFLANVKNVYHGAVAAGPRFRLTGR